MIASVTRLPMITNRKLVALVDPATNQDQIDWQRSALVGGLMPAELHHRRGQQDIRSERAGGPPDGDPADPQGERHQHEQHDRPARQLAARQQVQAVFRRAAAAATGPRGASSTTAAPAAQLSRHRCRRLHSGCNNSKHCAPPARSPTTSTTPSGSRSCPICSRIPAFATPADGLPHKLRVSTSECIGST